MIGFDIQRFAEVIHGGAGNDHVVGNGRNVQVYGLSGDDTVSGSGSNVILSGGSGNDVLDFKDGRATLNGGAGNDTFSLTYSEDAPVEILIEDIDPTNDRLLINYVGDGMPSLFYKDEETNSYGNISHTIILTDADGNLNITLPSKQPLDEYYDQVGNEYLWDVLRIVNEEREKVGASPLTFERDLMNGAAVRSAEIIELFGHTRPDGMAFSTVLEHGGYVGENIAVGYHSSDDVMDGWMNSEGHRANILNENYTRLGVGYKYDPNAGWKHSWVQIFRGYDVSDEVLSLDELLSTKVSLMIDGAIAGDWTVNDISPAPNAIDEDDDEIIVTSGGVYDTGLGNDLIVNGQYFSQGAGNTTLMGGAGNDTITNHGSNSVLLGGEGDDEIHNDYHYYQPWNAYYENNPADDANNEAFNGSNVLIDGGDGNDRSD